MSTWAVQDGWTVAVRDLIHWKRQPWLIAAGQAYSIVFVVLFGYVFGSAMSVPGGGDYREFMLPGLFVMTVAFGIGETMAVVSQDALKGVHDRLRTLNISAVSVVLGRAVADMLYALLSLTVLMTCGWLAGWRWHNSLAETAAAIGLILLLRFALIWVGIWLGLVVTAPEAVGAAWGLLFPVTMLANTFVAPQFMPSWLGAIAEWNPLSATATAIRRLFGNPVAAGDSWPAEHALTLAIAYPVLIVAICLPLAARRYRSRR